MFILLLNHDTSMLRASQNIKKHNLNEKKIRENKEKETANLWENLRFEDTSNYAPRAWDAGSGSGTSHKFMFILSTRTYWMYNFKRPQWGSALPLRTSRTFPLTVRRRCTIYTIHGGESRSRVGVKETAKFFKPNKMLKATHTKNICKRVEMRRQLAMALGKQQQLEMGEHY